jgi:hypothetical protein
LKNAMTLMMQQSDNAMTRAVVDHFGIANIQAYASSIGLTATHINHEVGCPTLNTLNTTSLADLTKIYEGVADGTLLNTGYRSAFYARMLNQSNYGAFRTYICNLAQQEATKLGKSSAQATAFCNAITWAAKGGDYTINSSSTSYDFHGGVADFGFPVKTNGTITSTKHWVYGEYVDHVVYASSAQQTNVGSARTAAQTAAITGPLDQALATW